MIDLETAKKRFQEAGITRSDRYATGTQGKGTKWNSAKARAKTNYAPAIQASLTNDSYGKGLDKATGQDYENGVATKGVNNWPVGMQASGEKFGAKIAKFVPLWGQELATPRGGRRSASNIKRMTENVARFTAAAGK
jgi:hypothetical protein